MKTNTGLNDETRLEVGQILNLILADEFVLYATTRDYHWNVTGPEFRSLHGEFEEQYELVAHWIDDVAERARAIGVGARGNWADLTKAARSSADPGIGLPAEHMLSELLALHEGDEAGDIVGGDGEAGHLFGDAGVAWRADDTGRGGRGDEGADERVFTATGADDQEGAWERCLKR
jgi:starvation-inducible DNA-binding protein